MQKKTELTVLSSAVKAKCAQPRSALRMYDAGPLPDFIMDGASAGRRLRMVTMRLLRFYLPLRRAPSAQTVDEQAFGQPPASFASFAAGGGPASWPSSSEN